MQQLTVRSVYDCINEFAPFATAEAYDNVGLLIGNWDTPVRRILCTLDVTKAAVDEARDVGAELIVSHHPLMFHGRKTLICGDPEADIIRSMLINGISLISAHTNWDQSVLSGSAASAEAIGIVNLQQSGYLFTGDLPCPMKAYEVKEQIETRVNAPVRVYGNRDQIIKVMSFGGGAFGEGYMDALTCGAQAYLTGEIRHHEIMDAIARGLVIFDAGHYASEALMIPKMVDYLQDKLSDYSPLCITPCHTVPFTGALI